MVPPVSESAPEIILTSDSPPLSLPKINTTSAVEFILSKAKENIENGCTKWLKNSVTGETIKLAELEPFSRSVASALSKSGMKQGDVAIYMTSNVTQIYPIILGVWRIGGIMYSSYPEDTQDTLLLRIQDTNARFIFCDPGSVQQVKLAVCHVAWPVDIFVFGNVETTIAVDKLFSDDGKDCPDQVPNSGLDEPILILCTSGTTGPSKGAVHTNKSILGFCATAASMPKTGKPTVLLSRCTHLTGAFFPIRNACIGSGVVMMHQATKENILNCVHEEKPAFVFGFPSFLMMLTSDPATKKYDLSSVQSVATGGAIVPENFYTSMMTLPNVKYVINGYGLTECGTLTSTLDHSSQSSVKTFKNQPKLSVGKLNANTALKVVDLETGLTVGTMKQGELVVRSPLMASSYWKRPEESAATFVDGWFRTGDLGYYDEEGYIFIVDRIKEILKYRANQISPSELEATILQHPAVAEVTVFGVLHPNGFDHNPRALVVLKPEQNNVSAETIREFAECNAKIRLAVYKHFRGGVYVVDALPRENTGKISKTEAAKILV